MPTRIKNKSFIKDLLAQPFPQQWESWLVGNMTHYRLLSEAERTQLKDDARVLISQKSWEGCDGLKLTEIMKLTVAAQAALLLLGLEHDYFSRVLSIVLFPTAFEAPPASWEGRGRVVAGQAVDYGTVFLSWETTLTEARDPAAGHNVVIHEFAHQLDFLDGYTNGVPALRSYQQTQRWNRVMQATFNRLRRDLQKGNRTLLGSYAATNATEFFSVASEKFFCLPHQLRQCHPDLFEVLAEYFRVDPLCWFKTAVGSGPDSHTVTPAVAAPVASEDCPPPLLRSPTLLPDFVDFKCPYCQNPVSFPKPDAGTLEQCPNCLESMIVPNQTGAPAERLPFPLRTERLLLRRFQTVDAKELAQLMSNPDTLRYLAWSPIGLEESEEWIARQSRIRFPCANAYCRCALEAAELARLIGLITIWFPNHDFDLAQFEVIIHPEWQRKGYATEAVRGLLAYALRGLRVRRIVAECDARNLAGRRLLLKAGLRQESECIQNRFVKTEWVSTVGFALLRQEYERKASRAKSVPEDYPT